MIFSQQLVVKAVSLAIARDGASGGVVRTVTVSCVLSVFFSFQLPVHQISTDTRITLVSRAWLGHSFLITSRSGIRINTVIFILQISWQSNAPCYTDKLRRRDKKVLS